MGSALEQAGEAGQMEEIRVLRALTHEMDMVKYGVSFHVPLHRLIAMLLQAGVQHTAAPLATLLPSQYRGGAFLAGNSGFPKMVSGGFQTILSILRP